MGMVALPPRGCHVGLARPMAAFAAGARGRQIARGDALEMRVLIEVQPDVRVAGLAGVAAHDATVPDGARVLRSGAVA